MPRDDGNGTQREYYLYEIKATVYPKRSGKIDADDVQIVVNYPTRLGKSRDPFESMLGGGGFGGMSSHMRQMMDDDFFGGLAFSGSLFGNRLSVTSSRPVVGQATVDSTPVVDVPTQGRPADYRGVVGRYKIVTQATPTAVSAGDPITLNIGVIGTGPIELAQAPPLVEFQSLTSDFKVEDQSLAGFVKDETKVFNAVVGCVVRISCKLGVCGRHTLRRRSRQDSGRNIYSIRRVQPACHFTHAIAA